MDKNHAKALEDLVKSGPNLPSEINLRDPTLYHNALFAQMYDSSQPPVWDSLCEELAEEAAITANDIVADLGCGSGRLTRYLQTKNPKKLYAIEPSTAMLKILKERLDTQKITIVLGSIDELIQSGVERPNKILSSGVFSVVTDPETLLRKVYSYLPQEGIYLFTVEDWRNANVDGEPTEMFNERFRAALKEIGMATNAPVIKANQETYTKEEVERCIQNAGGMVLKHRVKEMIHSGECAIAMLSSLLEGAAADQLPKIKGIQDIAKQFYAGKKITSGIQHTFVTTQKDLEAK